MISVNENYDMNEIKYILAKNSANYKGGKASAFLL